MKRYSIVIPAYNEEGVISSVLNALLVSPLKERCEIIVVDDHSSDRTREEALQHSVTVITNVQNFGYGYSLKRGISVAKGEAIIILDADGSYPIESLPRLIEEYEKGFDMVVGARQGVHYHSSLLKRIARIFFRALSEFSTGRHIPDINSGYRVFKRDIALRFFPTLSSGFSFTTTITLAFMLNAYSVHYIAVVYHKRTGHSKVRYLRDTLRSLQIIIESIVLYNPLKIFLLCALGILATGIIALFVGLLSSPWIGLLVFLVGALGLVVMSIGFLCVFLKFTHPRSDE